MRPIAQEFALQVARPSHVCEKDDLESCRRRCEVSKAPPVVDPQAHYMEPVTGQSTAINICDQQVLSESQEEQELSVLIGKPTLDEDDLQLATCPGNNNVSQLENDQGSPLQSLTGFPYIAVLAFCVLVGTAGTSVFSLRYTLTHEEEKHYLTPTAVLGAEFVKGSVSFAVVCFSRSFSTLYTNKAELLKTSVPALIYLLQNNLHYVAARHLQAATHQALFQIKLLTTACVWVLVFRRPLCWRRWVSLFALLGGLYCTAFSIACAGVCVF
mmetsp:Transcript_153848/g.493413  ORF Transcript_153848/g.493413 Transcript_153848/m.493413 type:complete len:270 (-) Transcript_153848:17-826(-)